MPGQFVRTRAKVGVIRNGVQVPQRAVILSEQGASVMLVGPKNIAVAQPVVLGSSQNGMWTITSGLKPGDRVIVNGLQKVRPGSPVTITPDATKRTEASSQSPAKQ